MGRDWWHPLLPGECCPGGHVFPGTQVGMNTLCMCCPSPGRAVTAVLTEAWQHVFQYQVLLCLRSSLQATRAPCVSVGPPGGAWFSAMYIHVGACSPQVCCGSLSHLSHQHVGYSGSELQVPRLSLLS